MRFSTTPSVQTTLRTVNPSGRSFLATRWVPDGHVFVYAARRYTFLVGTAATLKRLQVGAVDLLEQILGPPYAPRPTLAARNGSCLVEGPFGFQRTRPVSVAATAVRKAAPVGFWDDLGAGLEAADDAWVDRTRTQRATREGGLAWYRRERAGEQIALLCAPSADAPMATPLMPRVDGPLTVRGLSPNLFLDDARGSRWGYLHLHEPHLEIEHPSGTWPPLVMFDEEARAESAALLRGVLDPDQRGDHPALVRLDPECDLQRPYLPANLGWSRQHLCWSLVTSTNTIGLRVGQTFAVYFEALRHCRVVAESLADLLVNTLRRHGFAVDTYSVVHPEDLYPLAYSCDPMLLEMATNSDLWWAPPHEQDPDYRLPANPHHLRDDRLRPLPATVAGLLEVGVGLHENCDPESPARGFTGWTPAVAAAASAALGDRVPALPTQAAAWWREANELSPWHAPQLVAAKLVGTTWWADLPICAVMREPRLGTGQTWPKGPRWREPYAIDVYTMSDDELETTGFADVLRFYRRWNNLDGVDLTGFDGSSAARAGVAAAAVISQLGTPPALAVLNCRLCPCEYRTDQIAWFNVEEAGSREYCPGCLLNMLGTIDERDYPDTAEARVLVDAGVSAALRELHAELGRLPSERLLRTEGVFLADGAAEDRDRKMLLRMATPALREGAATAGESKRRTHTDWLAVAGLLDGSARAGRGVPSVATDGHATRSLMERHIDDWMSANEVWHTLEPRYPYDLELNRSGLRADWLLADGTFVEAAGMMSETAYREKMSRKGQLAARFGINLVVLTDSDLGALSQVLGRLAGRGPMVADKAERDQGYPTWTLT